MARVQAALGRDPLPPFFSGHSENGGPARATEHPHLAFQLDSPHRVLVIAPHVFEHRLPSRHERELFELLEDSLDNLATLRAGAGGLLTLRRVPWDPSDDPLFATSTVWKSRTPYAVNRHAKRRSIVEAVTLDVEAECRRRGLPAPAVAVETANGVAGCGVAAHLVLRFPVAVKGPVLLGRTRHVGGGLFAANRAE